MKRWLRSRPAIAVSVSGLQRSEKERLCHWLGLESGGGWACIIGLWRDCVCPIWLGPLGLAHKTDLKGARALGVLWAGLGRPSVVHLSSLCRRPVVCPSSRRPSPVLRSGLGPNQTLGPSNQTLGRS